MLLFFSGILNEILFFPQVSLAKIKDLVLTDTFLNIFLIVRNIFSKLNF